MRRIAAFLALGLVAVVAVPAAASSERAFTPKSSGIDWQPCYTEMGPFECASVKVPLDHDRPTGRQINLAVVRLPATDPASKIGSLFLNPGGPGGSGVEFVLGAAQILFTPEVRASFDLVGFDPRGIGGSNPLQCFSSIEEAIDNRPEFAFPVTPDEEAEQAQADEAFNASCEDKAGPIIDHMSTANVARDMDLLRRKVGDKQLNFAGYSYGSFLGTTYANMFPNKVRAVVVDGVLDPVAWTTGYGGSRRPFSTRLRSDVGAQSTLNEFFRLCDAAGPSGCDFAGNSAERFAAIADQLLKEPIEFEDPSGEVFSFKYSDLIGFMLGSMYDSGGWTFTASSLVELEQMVSAPEADRAAGPAAAPSWLQERRARYENLVEGGVGVFCSDSDNPKNEAAWPANADRADAETGYFGRPWTWISSPCAKWSGFDKDRYMGPFTKTTANPILVVGTRHDAATRFQGAQAVHRLMPESSLLTVEGWGHTSLFLSECADNAVAGYFLTGTPPEDGTRCKQDYDPFATEDEDARAPASRADRASREKARRDVMSEVAPVQWG